MSSFSSRIPLSQFPPRIEALRMAVENMPAKSQEFAFSLINQWKTRRSLSITQWQYVDKLAAEYAKPKLVRTRAQIEGFTEVERMLHRARAHNQFPAIRLPDPLGGMNKLIFRPKMKNGVNVWYGDKIIGTIADDNFISQNEHAIALVEHLRNYARNPTEYGATIGRKVGWCVYCGLTLTNPSSVYHGYGPICAENYGLPWGDVPETKQANSNLLNTVSLEVEPSNLETTMASQEIENLYNELTTVTIHKDILADIRFELQLRKQACESVLDALPESFRSQSGAHGTKIRCEHLIAEIDLLIPPEYLENPVDNLKKDLTTAPECANISGDAKPNVPNNGNATQRKPTLSPGLARFAKKL